MKTNALPSLAAVLAVIVLPARAATTIDTFGSGANTFTIDFVDIGNPGNGDDAGAGGGSYSSPFGGVSYAYRMGAYEISQDAITKATASGLASVTAGAWSASKPAANMDWYEAAAFVNWLNTSTGHHKAYDLTFSGIWNMAAWSSGEAWQTGGQNLFRHKDAFYFLPSEDEWFKAAYHKNDGATANYWDYPTGSNNIPTAIISGTGAGTALYDNTPISPADVDQDGGLSPYGTRGQGGNVFEWVESAFDGVNNLSNESRPIRGGAWYFGEDGMRSSLRLSYGPRSTGNDLGFRVASVVPEPSSLALLAVAAVGLVARRKRHARAG